MTIEDEEVKVGNHCWAMGHGHLMVVVKKKKGDYYQCGSNGMPISSEYLSIISIIPKPDGYEDTPPRFSVRGE